jgi:hypothetical protein
MKLGIHYATRSLGSDTPRSPATWNPMTAVTAKVELKRARGGRPDSVSENAVPGHPVEMSDARRDALLEDLSEPALLEICQIGQATGLELHKFKRTMAECLIELNPS